MRILLSPYYTQQQPPPPSAKSASMSILYYGLVVLGTTAAVLAIYNLIILKWCAANYPRSQPQERVSPPQRVAEQPASSRGFDSPNADLISSFKYKKRGGKDQMNEYECPVCLSVFEEGEYVRELPKCKHCFHTSCIDMWLLNRVACHPRPARSSREGMLDPSIFGL